MAKRNTNCAFGDLRRSNALLGRAYAALLDALGFGPVGVIVGRVEAPSARWGLMYRGGLCGADAAEANLSPSRRQAAQCLRGLLSPSHAEKGSSWLTPLTCR